VGKPVSNESNYFFFAAFSSINAEKILLDNSIASLTDNQTQVLKLELRHNMESGDKKLIKTCFAVVR